VAKPSVAVWKSASSYRLDSSCGLLNQSHTRTIHLPVSFRFRSSQPVAPHNRRANFGIGTLEAAAHAAVAASAPRTKTAAATVFADPDRRASAVAVSHRAGRTAEIAAVVARPAIGPLIASAAAGRRAATLRPHRIAQSVLTQAGAGRTSLRAGRTGKTDAQDRQCYGDPQGASRGARHRRNANAGPRPRHRSFSAKRSPRHCPNPRKLSHRPIAPPPSGTNRRCAPMSRSKP